MLTINPFNKDIEKKRNKQNKEGFQAVTANFVGKTRFDTMWGKNYLVAPMVMLVEGVHAGSSGPLYYPPDELKKAPFTWNHKPVVVYHPQKEDGEAMSACSPDVLNARGIGLIMNTICDSVEVEVNGNKIKLPALKAEAWIDVDRAKSIDKRIMGAVENGKVMELSTGLFSDNEEKEGEWNGEKYIAVAKNYRPDHLALLPDQKGACSVADGAGFLLNEEESHETLRNNLQALIQEQFGNQIWVEAVFDDFFIYNRDNKLFKLGYSIVDGKEKLVEDKPESITKSIVYKDADGGIIGNKRKEWRKINKKWIMVENPFVANYVRKVKGKWFVFSEKGKRLGGPYKTEEEANKRLNQIEFFKHQKK